MAVKARFQHLGLRIAFGAKPHLDTAKRIFSIVLCSKLSSRLPLGCLVSSIGCLAIGLELGGSFQFGRTPSLDG
jgi:hypothetical protein